MMKNTIEDITLDGFVLSGAGANGESYDCVADPTIMLKLYNETYPTQPVFDELEIARKVYELGVPSPKPGRLVKVGNRLGIIFNKVQGKRSFSRALADEPERVDEFAVEFAQACRNLHSIQCPEGMFPKQSEVFLSMLKSIGTFNEDEKQKIAQFIESIPEYRCAVHGDLHIGNILTTLPKGAPMSTPHDILYIDLGYFAEGCPLIDIAMLYNVCLISSEEFRLKEMHVGYDVTKKFWDRFVEEYFLGPDKLGQKLFGHDVTAEQVNTLMRPYCAVLSIFISYNLGFVLPEFEELIRTELL